MSSLRSCEDPIQPILLPGRDYPCTYREFVTMFPDENACAIYLEGLRWLKGFVCTACGMPGEPWRQTRGRLVCSACRHQSSVSAGTILDKTRTPLTTWFEVAWHVTTAKNGMSAKNAGTDFGHELSSCLDDVASLPGRNGACCTRAPDGRGGG